MRRREEGEKEREKRKSWRRSEVDSGSGGGHDTTSTRDITKENNRQLYSKRESERKDMGARGGGGRRGQSRLDVKGDRGVELDESSH